MSLVTFQHLALGFVLASACATSVGADEVAESRLADLDVVQHGYIDQAPVFSPDAREQAHALIVDLRGRAPAMTDAQFMLALARFAGLADNGHDSIHPGEGSWRPKLRLPVRMIWFADALLVARAGPDSADLLVASIVTIDGLTPGELMERLRPLQGGIDGYRRWDMNWIIHSPEALHAIGLARHPDRLELQLKLPNGRAVTRMSMHTRRRRCHPAGSGTLLDPGLWDGSARKGGGLPSIPPAPLYLPGPTPGSHDRSAGSEALYVQFRSTSTRAMRRSHHSWVVFRNI